MAKRNYSIQDESLEHDDTDTEIGLDDKVTETDNPEGGDDEDETNPGSDFDDLHPHLFDNVPDEADEDEDDLDEEDEDEDEGEEEATDEEEEEEEDPAPRGKNPFRKRLARMERQLKEVKEDNAALAKRNKAIETANGQRQAEAERATKKTELTTKLEAAREELDTLLEAGDNPKAIREATEALADIKSDLRDNERAAAAAKKIEEEAPVADLAVKKAARWRRAHPKFLSDPGFAGFTREIDKALQAEGLDPNDDEFWTELDTRVKERFPEEYRGKKGAKGGKDDDKGRRRKPPTRDTGHADRNAGQARRKAGETFQRRGNKVIVTADQKRNMRRFGMDPDDPADLKTYIRENLKK